MAASVSPLRTVVLYALRVLRAHGMDDVSLQTIFRSVVVAKLMHASNAWWGFAAASDRQRLAAFIRRSDRSRFVPANLPTFADLCHDADEKMFAAITSDRNHVLHHHVLHHLHPAATVHWFTKLQLAATYT